MNTKVSVNIQKGKKGYTISFRHPIVKDKDNKYGLKMHRGLGTSDLLEAERLAEELKKLLEDGYWADISKKNEAYQHFNDRIVDAFYDPIEGENPDLKRMLDKIKLPGKEDGYTRQTIVGASGAGKTSLLRLLAGTNKEKFPTTSTGRTTTCNLELIQSEDEEYEVVVTFMTRYVVEMYVQECIEAALEYCFLEKCENLDRNIISKHLFINQDLIFRLSYIIGDLSLETHVPNDLDEEFEEFNEEIDDEIEEAEIQVEQDIEALLKNVNYYIDKVIGIARIKLESNENTLDEEFNITEDNDILSLKDEIMEEIMMRFQFLKGGEKLNSKGKWTNAWYFKSKDREEFIRVVKRFSSNNWRLWGSLLTPIVKTMRVKGKFKPDFSEKIPKQVLFDGQGLGHKTTMTSMPIDTLEYFKLSDGIVIVDNAQQPVLDNVKMAIRTIIQKGYFNKVCFAYTHMDLMKGDNFKNFQDRKVHVNLALESYLNEMKHKEPDSLSYTEIDTLLDSCYYFSCLDKQKITGLSKQSGEKLIGKWKEKLVEEITIENVKLSYDAMTLFLHVQTGIENFRNFWGEKIGYPFKSVKTLHWSKIRALTRRLGYTGEDSYGDELAPLADFSDAISAQMNIFMNRPVCVIPEIVKEEVKVMFINEVKREISDKMLGFVKKEMWMQQEQLQRWKDAYNFCGTGSSFQRASKINEIFDFAAPKMSLLSYNMTAEQKRYINSIFEIVEGTLKEFGCTLERFKF